MSGERRPELLVTGWGNPFWTARRPDGAANGEWDARGAVQRYCARIMGPPQLLTRHRELRGKILGCWRAPPGALTSDLAAAFATVRLWSRWRMD